MRKPSNEKRLRLNRQCREALAANIYDRLRIIVAPDKVRLQPRPGDGYAWSVTTANAALLKSSLSSGNIRLYRSICEEVGHSIEAVSPHTPGNSQSNTGGIPKEAEGFGEAIDGSFTAEIFKLKAANSSLEIELQCTRVRLNDCLGKNHTVRAEANELRHDMQILQSHNRKLHDELTEARAGIAKARRILNSLQTEGIEVALDSEDRQ